MIIHLIVGFIKRYRPEPYTRSENQIKVKLDLSNYATKCDLKSNSCQYIRFC